jgi:hypothetical protein
VPEAGAPRRPASEGALGTTRSDHLIARPLTPLIVLHDLGEMRGAADWRNALDAGGWAGPWSAPDLPGHGEAAWECDYYDPADIVMIALRWLRERAWSAIPVVVAVGQQAVVGEFLALGGRASGLVRVDAPSVMDLDPDESQRITFEWLRALADDSADSRMPRRLPPQTDAAWSARQRAAISVPMLELDAAPETEVLAAARVWWDSRADGR